MNIVKRLKTTAIISSALLFSTNYASAQTTSPAEMKKAAKSVCNCLEKRGDKAKTQEQAQLLFSQCVLDSGMNVFTSVMLKANGDQAKATKLGQEIAMQLGAEMLKQGCPAFMKMSTTIVGGAAEKVETEVAGKTEEIAGTIEQVAEDEFLTITIKTAAGREYKLYYLSYVEGSDGWLKNTSTLKGKKVIIGYLEKEFYQPKAQTFVGIKQITSLELMK